MRVLVTGAAGALGRRIHHGLLERGDDVVGLDRLPAPGGIEGAWHTVECSDPAAVRSVFAAEPLDAVVHLAGHPDEMSLPDALTSHLLTTAALLDAMVEHRVDRIVYASSNHAVGLTPRSDLLGVDAAPRPDTFYGVGKVAAEALLRLYADRYGIDAVACRIGSYGERPTSVRQLATWLSPDDTLRMVEAALTAPSPGFALLYGISANSRGWWDLEPGRALGYHPVDDAEAFAAEIETGPDDDAENAVVGGPFAGPAFYRQAFGEGGSAAPGPLTVG